MDNDLEKKNMEEKQDLDTLMSYLGLFTILLKISH